MWPLGRLVSLLVIAASACALGTGIHAEDAYAAAMAAASLAVAVDSPARRRVLLLLAMAGAAMGQAARARDRALAPPLAVVADRADPLEVDGRLASDAEPADGGVRLLIDVDHVRRAGLDAAVTGRIQAFVAGALAGDRFGSWRAGRSVRATMTVKLPQVWLNPGGPSLWWQRLTERADLVGTVKSAALVGVRAGPWWSEWASAVRASIRRRSRTLFGPDQTTAGLVEAILIGDRAGLADETVSRLQRGGTYHVIAISGGNVALVAALAFLGLRLFIRSFRAAAIVTAALIVAYGWVVGGDVSVSRAVMAACVYLGASLVGLAPDALDVLAVVALAAVLLDPLTCIDRGAWLSFGATFGIIVAAGRWTAWTSAWSARRGRLAALAGAGLALLGATLAAELTLLPVTATLFSRVGAAGLVLNFVAIPMMAVLQVAGALGIALVDRFPHVAAVPAAAARWSGWLLLGSARLVDVLPWLSWRVPPPPWWALAAFYAAGVWWFVRARGRTRAVAAGVFAAAAVLVAFAPETALARPGKDVLRFTVVDVGQGDALLVQLPSGRDLAIDGGTRVAGFDAGDRLVTPALWASGVRRLDWAAFTHADLDHIGGVDSLVSTFSPREIWEGVPVEPDPKRRALVRHAGDAGIVWRGVRKGDAVRDGAVTVDVLNPPEPDWQRRRVRNDDSVVMRVRYGDVELLLTGDIGEEAERAIDASADRAAIRILKVAHHGSRTSSSPDFVTRYAPDVAVVSVGRSNLFGHPSPEVVQRLARAGAVVFRTDRDGAIILETDGRSVHVRSMAGRVWTVGVRRARS